jgi:hypothetical protein
VTVGIDHQNNGAGFEQRHRRKIPDQVDGFVAIGDLIGDDGQGRQKNRVAILGGVSDIVGGDARSGPRLVFNDELLAEDRCAPAARMRAATSAAAPGVKPITTWMGRDG